ncbi:DUF5947 family protein [Plantactinospora endophytica]|uniref:Uncharacterized protein n=1 Tax=Plantactinospora endophytica TaxID=673535 RepID=A0ABQ4DZX1_9ACTN|nr:DUF5947 family protein [Plantactinospora endophytica]GIG87972.1 hypothetical protein Pen02_29080 [Plantactinospora endophytica]
MTSRPPSRDTVRYPVRPAGLRRLVTRSNTSQPNRADQVEPAGPAGQAGPVEQVGAVARAGDGAQRCDLCAAEVPAEHRHLVDTADRVLRCACRACALLFDRPPGDPARYRLVPDRRWRLTGFALDDAAWAGLRIPVDTAFFFVDSGAGRTVAFYPSPAGAVESLLDLADWARLVTANPVLDRLVPDVEALLVHRTPDVREHWLVPIDDCYDLVGLIRSRWTGLAGGPDVWREIAAFFTRLRDRARPLPATPATPAGTAGKLTDPTSATGGTAGKLTDPNSATGGTVGTLTDPTSSRRHG